MLLLLIPITWLALAAFFVCVCRVAGQGDAAHARPLQQPRERGTPIPSVVLSARAR